MAENNIYNGKIESLEGSLHIERVDHLQVGPNNTMNNYYGVSSSHQYRHSSSTSYSSDDEHDITTENEFLDTCDAELDEDVTKQVAKVISAKWLEFGTEFKLPEEQLDQILEEYDNEGYNALALRVLKLWLNGRTNVKISDIAKHFTDEYDRHKLYSSLRTSQNLPALKGNQKLTIKASSGDEEEDATY
ncbi:hypothetical protein SNE40_015327 [Patella caerulea]|uniref:Death domain-containing protein n=1 Tax=Patella caerulea TaxID=87958 RepID=A0AAN8JJT5_PATCE